jgi:hypothetical protein
MRCEKCGAELEENTRFCPKCDVEVIVPLQTSENNYKKERAGFTTFWLIFLLIMRIISIALLLFSIILTLFEIHYISSGLIILYLISSILGMTGHILLLLWKKVGFWIFLGNSISFSILLFIKDGMRWSNIIGSCLSILFMWSVLQIQKNGKTTWEQLI